MSTCARSPRSALLVALFTISLAGPSSAQFGNDWQSFTDETATRLGVPPNAVSDNANEVDFDTGDLDLNGFVDLVVVRKQPFTTSGKRTNMLLLNENGVLVDRTALASSSDVPGDQGFSTPTNDRDVVVTDVDQDGWPDVVTATTLSAGDPKHISHPRVYRNLGSAGSSWNGLRHEDARFPQLFKGSTPVAPGFCAVAAGDITGNGYPDLYFVDYSGGFMPVDIDDRLLINDGNGFFTDESALRMTAQQLSSGFGTSGAIVDLNGDGLLDIVKNWAGNTRAIYQDPNAPGTFSVLQTPYNGSSYHVNAGDLNADGRIDLVISDDGSDRYKYNNGTDAFGQAVWGPAKTFQFLSGGDDGFGSNNYIVDLDQDGFGDAIIADVDVDISGCNRRIHIYHNKGGLAGQELTLVEERQQAGGGWVGVAGPTEADLKGGHDVAVFDIDNNGSLDLVLGRCTGTFVWMNQDACQEDLGFGGPGFAHLSMCGGDLSAGTQATFRLKAAEPNQVALLFIGLQANPTPVPDLGGVLVPIPVLTVVSLPTGPQGQVEIPGVSGGGGPLDVYVQAVIPDPSQAKGFQVSNAMRIHFQP